MVRFNDHGTPEALSIGNSLLGVKGKELGRHRQRQIFEILRCSELGLRNLSSQCAGFIGERRAKVPQLISVTQYSVEFVELKNGDPQIISSL